MGQNIIAGLFLIFIGIAIMIKPVFIWKIADSWKSKDMSEPTSIYIQILRIVGAVLLVGGIAAIILG